MEPLCDVPGESLSRFLDGELPLLEHRRLRAHVEGCPACAQRLSRYRLVGDLAARTMGDPAEASRPALWLSVAAALIASLATNLLLPVAPTPSPAPVFTRSAPTSEGLSVFYAQLAPEGAAREVRD